MRTHGERRAGWPGGWARSRARRSTASGSFTFSWNGRTVPAYSTGTPSCRRWPATGQRVFSRSYKYHRPRGLLTASFHDPGCFFQVGDEPNVRGAHRLAEPGMDVRSQNTWPSLGFDVKAVNQLAGRFLGPGFYYKTFIRPQRLWPLYETRAAAVRARRARVSPDTPRTVVRQALRPSRRAGRRRRPGRPGRRGGGRAGRRPGACWSRRSTGSAATCAGADAGDLAALAELRDLSRPRRGSRC